MGQRTDIYAALTGAPKNSVEAGEVVNAAIHAISLSLTKCADGLLDPKLVLSWLLNSLGAPAAIIGTLVPVREAGSLLPQLALAPLVERTRFRKHIWAFASAMQGVAALAIALAVFTLDGKTAGWVTLLALAALAIARSGASLSYKDALARTIPKTRRGAVSGIPGSIAATFVLAFGASLASGVLPLNATTLALGIALGGMFWLVAAGLFLRLNEDGGADAASGNFALQSLIAPLREDRQLRLFIIARALLTVTALAPPFIVMLSAQGQREALDQLGPLIIASAAASILSGYVWGRLSDHSSRKTMIASALLAATVFAGITAIDVFGDGLNSALRAAGAIFGAQIAYEGVRAARKLHLTDMVGDDRRARYTALSNTIIGGVLVVGGAFGVLADQFGPAAIITSFIVISIAGALVAMRLDEVQKAP